MKCNCRDSYETQVWHRASTLWRMSAPRTLVEPACSCYLGLPTTKVVSIDGACSQNATHGSPCLKVHICTANMKYKSESSDKCLGCSPMTAVISKTPLLPQIRHLIWFCHHLIHVYRPRSHVHQGLARLLGIALATHAHMHYKQNAKA